MSQRTTEHPLFVALRAAAWSAMCLFGQLAMLQTQRMAGSTGRTAAFEHLIEWPVRAAMAVADGSVGPNAAIDLM
ncbi:MAG: hypothetical protein ABJQ66_03855, partial [Paracoccaceae bacterium]